jgi:hypothetical protein
MNEHGNAIIFDETSIVVNPVSEQEQTWTIASDVPFTMECTGQEQEVKPYGIGFTYYTASVAAPFTETVTMRVQCQDGRALVVEMRKEQGA